MFHLAFRGFLRGHKTLKPNFQKLFAVQISNDLFQSKRCKSEVPFSSDLGSCTILIQDGCNVQELPLIIRRVKNVLAPTEHNQNEFSNNSNACNSDLHKLIHKEFLKCSNCNEVISLLAKCSSITPNIAVGAMERIFDLNELLTSKDILQCDIKESDALESELLDKLLDIILSSEDVYCLMNGIEALNTLGGKYRHKLSDELLSRVIDNKLSVKQLCHAVRVFSLNKGCPKSMQNTDKLWIGFTDHEKNFTKENLMDTVEILPLLKTSQRMVLGLVERSISSLWWQLSGPDLVTILEVLHSSKIPSSRILHIVARWINTNVHTLPEDVFLEIITKCTELKYTDDQIQKALERYMKAKGVKISLHTLVVSILNHCFMFRIRNGHILNGCAEHFIAHGRNLPAMYIRPMLFPFGWLNFNPSNRIKFWEEVEFNFNENFSKINAEDVLDIMLACIYLQKYPLNFVEKVFNPHFLQRVNRLPNYVLLRNKLKLIDTAMSLECKHYQGPLLPRDHRSKSLRHDGRLRHLVNQLQDTLRNVAGGDGMFSSFVVLPNIFTTELYIVDVMLHPKGLRSSILNLNLRSDRNISTAMLIHVPEHYSANGQSLIGPQAMRVKHLKLLGLKVVSLNYEMLYKLKIHPTALNRYLVDMIKNAEPAAS